MVRGGSYEPVVGFLRAINTDRATTYLSVTHSRGQLHVSANHVVFTPVGDKLAADLLPGDEVLVTEGSSRAVASKVLALTQMSGRSGMFAPLTASGTVVVDHVVASSYASLSTQAPLRHCALHAIMFPLRMLHALGLADLLELSPAINAAESMHPYAAFLLQHLGPVFAKMS